MLHKLKVCFQTDQRRRISERIFPWYVITTISIGGSKGAPGTRDPHRGPNSFIFMQFSAKICKIIPTWRPYLRKILDPPLIRHTYVYIITIFYLANKREAN